MTLKVLPLYTKSLTGVKAGNKILAINVNQAIIINNNKIIPYDLNTHISENM